MNDLQHHIHFPDKRHFTHLRLNVSFFDPARQPFVEQLPQTAIQTGGNSGNEFYFGKYETMGDFDIDEGRKSR